MKNQFGAWRQLIEAAEGWEYGKEMLMRDEAIEFIKFVIDQVKSAHLYQKMYFNENNVT